MGKQHFGFEYDVSNGMVKGALGYPDFSLTHKRNIYSGCAFVRCLQPPMHYVILDFSGQGLELWNAPTEGKTSPPYFLRCPLLLSNQSTFFDAFIFLNLFPIWNAYLNRVRWFWSLRPRELLPFEFIKTLKMIFPGFSVFLFTEAWNFRNKIIVVLLESK